MFEVEFLNRRIKTEYSIDIPYNILDQIFWDEFDEVQLNNRRRGIRCQHKKDKETTSDRIITWISDFIKYKDSQGTIHNIDFNFISSHRYSYVLLHAWLNENYKEDNNYENNWNCINMWLYSWSRYKGR